MMKTLIPILIAIAAVLAVAAPQEMAEPPFSTVIVMDDTNAVADFELAEAVQPETLRLWGVLPLSPTPQTVTVERVATRTSYVGTNGEERTITYTNPITSFVLASNVSSASTSLTDAVWVLLGDNVRLRGPTNAFMEFQGNR